MERLGLDQAYWSSITLSTKASTEIAMLTYMRSSKKEFRVIAGLSGNVVKTVVRLKVRAHAGLTIKLSLWLRH